MVARTVDFMGQHSSLLVQVRHKVTEITAAEHISAASVVAICILNSRDYLKFDRWGCQWQHQLFQVFQSFEFYFE